MALEPELHLNMHLGFLSPAFLNPLSLLKHELGIPWKAIVSFLMYVGWCIINVVIRANNDDYYLTLSYNYIIKETIIKIYTWLIYLLDDVYLQLWVSWSII